MSIFVDASKRFQISINFDEVKTENGDLICYKFSESGSNTVVCDVKARNFADMSHIIEEATIINSVSGNPLLRTSVLCKNIITNFFSVIKIKDGDNEETYYPDPNNVNMIRYELVKALSKKWLEMTGGK